MTLDPRDLQPTDLMYAEQARRRALRFFEQHPELVKPDEEAARIAAEGQAVRLVCRYHGPGHDLAQRVQPWAARGRGECSRCGHPVYFDDREKMRAVLPMTFVCLLCMLAELPQEVVPEDARAELACPTDCGFVPQSS